LIGEGLDSLCGTQSGGTGVLFDARQHSPVLGAYQYVSTVWTLNLSCAIGSTRSRNNVLTVELDSHADTCVVDRHALLVHEHPKVVMVSDFDPSQLS